MDRHMGKALWERLLFSWSAALSDTRTHRRNSVGSRVELSFEAEDSSLVQKSKVILEIRRKETSDLLIAPDKKG